MPQGQKKIVCSGFVPQSPVGLIHVPEYHEPERVWKGIVSSSTTHDLDHQIHQVMLLVKISRPAGR